MPSDQLSDYEVGQEIARKGWFIKADAGAEIWRGYADELERQRREVERWLETRNTFPIKGAQ